MWNMNKAIGARFRRNGRKRISEERTYCAVALQALQYGVVISMHYGAFIKYPLNKNLARCDPQCWTACASSKDS
jgi:hypothetical protein